MLLANVINYVRKISFTMYFVGAVLFFSIIGLIPLFGYTITVSQERIKNGVNSDPPPFGSILSLTGKGLISLFIVALTLIPSGIIYVTIPFLIDMVDIESSIFISLILMIITIVGIMLSLIGLYLFSAILFAYSRYSVDKNLTFVDSILYTLFQICFSKKYFKSFIFIVVISLIFGLMTEVLFLSVILAPLASVIALIYFTTLGYIIGSLTTEFRTVHGLPIIVTYLRRLDISDFKQMLS